eukprot:CAMPEP_0203861682 /NCGR_PEP_ID=MMETSP0359-20131031/13155_1 /ASSEMBLY_ACC=CAM_ASM_000338 /TAXON_ID=268821 /ORGANISM="Scrippsiella Hangoei, Strain SHTV-5" /LENGTH=152 /DNA_ID=CAMNT_0050778959 /DNA_START=56 /DNA_END=511 /DNA_ORIENTATION=+
MSLDEQAGPHNSLKTRPSTCRRPCPQVITVTTASTELRGARLPTGKLAVRVESGSTSVQAWQRGGADLGDSPGVCFQALCQRCGRVRKSTRKFDASQPGLVFAVSGLLEVALVDGARVARLLEGVVRRGARALPGRTSAPWMEHGEFGALRG